VNNKKFKKIERVQDPLLNSVIIPIFKISGDNCEDLQLKLFFEYLAVAVKKTLKFIGFLTFWGFAIIFLMGVFKKDYPRRRGDYWRNYY
jgi:hypothetical protein